MNKKEQFVNDLRFFRKLGLAALVAMVLGFMVVLPEVINNIR